MKILITGVAGFIGSHLAAQTKSKSQIKLIPYIDMFGNGFEDMMRRKPNINKMNEYFDWRPTVSLENSINQIIKFFKTK